MGTQKFSEIPFQTFGDGFDGQIFTTSTNLVLAAIIFLHIDGSKEMEKDFIIRLANSISSRLDSTIENFDKIFIELSEKGLISEAVDDQNKIIITEKLVEAIKKKYGQIMF